MASAVALGTSSKLVIDYMVQRKENNEGSLLEYDRHRGLSFALFGALYLGVCQVTSLQRLTK